MWSHMTCGHVFYVSKYLASHFFKWTLKKKLDLGDRGVSPIFQILFLCINAIFEFKKIFSLRCFFFFQNLVASCACRSKGHCVAICPHCRRVVRTFLFLILFIYFPINGVERYNDAKTSLECGMNPQMHGTTPSLKRLWVDIYQPTFGIFVILRSDFLFLLLIHLPDKKSLYIWHLLLVAVGNVSHAVN